MVKTVFRCGDRDRDRERLVTEDYNPDNYPVSMINTINTINTSMGLADFIMNSPLITALSCCVSLHFLRCITSSN